MAKPNDTRITHVPANANPSSRPSNTPGSSIPIPATSNLTVILEALLAKQAADDAAPKPPKSARPPRIKPRRRVTVTPAPVPAPASDANLPWIRLCGHWLTHAGFALHKRARVHVGKGFMILIAEDES